LDKPFVPCIDLITAGRISDRRQIAANKAEKLTTRSRMGISILLLRF
jgi:hypothetical protein